MVVVMTRKEIVLIAGAIAGLLGAFGVVVAPEQIEAVIAALVLVLPILGAAYARGNVASKESVEKKLGPGAEAQLFGRKRSPRI